MNRRSFLLSLLSTAVLDPERLLWVPSKTTIFIPAGHIYGYSDFITLSTLLVDTAIDDEVAQYARDLGYRAGLSVDTIILRAVERSDKRKRRGHPIG